MPAPKVQVGMLASRWQHTEDGVGTPAPTASSGAPRGEVQSASDVVGNVLRDRRCRTSLTRHRR